MKYLTLLTIIFFVGCTSSGDREIDHYSLGKNGEKMRVTRLKEPIVSGEVLDKNGKIVKRIETQKMTVYQRRAKAYEKKPLRELAQMLKTGDAEQVSIVIEALSNIGIEYQDPRAVFKNGKKILGEKKDISEVVRILATLLTDKRKVVLAEDNPLQWAEAKTIYEDVQIRIYAAYNIQRITSNNKPGGMTFKHHRRGLLYCVKSGHAQIKNDVAAAWLKWWDEYGQKMY